MYSAETSAKANKQPRITEDPIAPKQHVKAAKQAAGVGVPKIPKPPIKKQTQTVKEKMEALKADVKSQKMGPAVTSKVSDVMARKGGALKAKHTSFDKTYKENERIADIVKTAQERSSAMTSAHAAAEADQLGNLLGSVQHDLHPLHRRAIEARATQLRDLVRNVPSVSEHMDKGLKLQESFQKIGDAARDNDDVARRLIGVWHGGPPSQMRHSVGTPSVAMSMHGDSESAMASSRRPRSSRASSVK